MRISGDRATSLIGLAGSLLFAQQVWFPELLPMEVAGSFGAALIASGGMACNKKEIQLLEGSPELAQLQAQIRQLEQELERGIHHPGFPEPGGDDERP